VPRLSNDRTIANELMKWAETSDEQLVRKDSFGAMDNRQ